MPIDYLIGRISSVQSLSLVQIFATPWTAALQASLSFTSSRKWLKLMSTKMVIHPSISSSVIPFSSCLQPFPASGSFPMSQFFTSGGQSIGASASVLPMNTQGWFPLRLTSLISLQSKGILPQFKSINSLVLCLFYGSTLTFIHDYWKNHSFD